MVQTEDLDKEIIYDKDNIQLVRRIDEATGKPTYSIITPESFVVLTEEQWDEMIQLFALSGVE